MAIRRMTFIEHTRAHGWFYLNCACIGIGAGFIAAQWSRFDLAFLISGVINLCAGIRYSVPSWHRARAICHNFYQAQLWDERTRVRLSAKERL
jgi:hypothetical protein